MKSKIQCPLSISRTCLAQEFGLVLNQETEIARLKAALKEEQGKSQSMGMVVKYLENAKDTLEREKQALLQNKSSEVSVIN